MGYLLDRDRSMAERGSGASRVVVRPELVEISRLGRARVGMARALRCGSHGHLQGASGRRGRVSRSRSGWRLANEGHPSAGGDSDTEPRRVPCVPQGRVGLLGIGTRSTRSYELVPRRPCRWILGSRRRGRGLGWVSSRLFGTESATAEFAQKALASAPRRPWRWLPRARGATWRSASTRWMVRSDYSGLRSRQLEIGQSLAPNDVDLLNVRRAARDEPRALGEGRGA